MSLTVNLPLAKPSPEKQAFSENCANYIKQMIQAHHGAISFDHFMQLALYAPHYGYYTGGSHKFGKDGDFITAPEISPWFGRTLAEQVREVLQHCEQPCILEFGAGTGKLAYELIASLHQEFPNLRYEILELSPDLQQRQQETLQSFLAHVHWRQELPQAFEGVVVANEILDAMPVKLLEKTDEHTYHEYYVKVGKQGFEWHKQAATEQQVADLNTRFQHWQEMAELEPSLPYRTEIHYQAMAWIREMGRWLKKGLALLIDYGYLQSEYYHPLRTQGTLIAHFQHSTHNDVLNYVGIQDLTSHIDFTAIMQAAEASGLDVMGYTSQARFLLNCGLVTLLSKSLDPNQHLEYAQTIAPIQHLIAESEMGVRFKVLGLAKNLPIALIGFDHT